MRMVRAVLLAGAASVWSGSALAADALKFGPAPAWVHQQALPPAKTTQAPVQLLLDDEQISLEPGKITSYREGAMRIENSQGLAAAGNLSVVWQPETETVTVNKLQIIRGGKTIDVLAGGPDVHCASPRDQPRRRDARRDPDRDHPARGTADRATCWMLATTTERSDPVMKGHVEFDVRRMGTGFRSDLPMPACAGRRACTWTSGKRPTCPPRSDRPRAAFTTIDLLGRDVQPLVAPKGAPERFKIGRLAEATDFRILVRPR